MRARERARLLLVDGFMGRALAGAEIARMTKLPISQVEAIVASLRAAGTLLFHQRS